MRHQIGVLSPVVTTFLIPDNHIGRATVSSVAVAHEVQQMGGRSIACLNARDRNLLGFRRDLLTAAAYGVDQFLFVYGDDPTAGADQRAQRADHAREGRAYAATLDGGRPMRFGAASGLRPLPAWKQAADFLCVQIGFSVDDLLAWRATVEVDVPVYAGVIVVASAGMARHFTIPGLTVPPDLVARLEKDRNAGVDAACDLVAGLRESGAFDGVHLIPVALPRGGDAIWGAKGQAADHLFTLCLGEPQPEAGGMSACSSASRDALVTSNSESTTKSARPKAG